MCKAICGVAAGAVGGVFNLHWAQGSDIADIQAKFGAQHTVTGSLGLLCAYQFVQTVAKSNPLIFGCFTAALTVLHLYANMRCMKIIAFDYLNTPRMRMVIQQFLEQWNNGQAENLSSIMEPKVLARKEPLLFGITSRRKPTSSRILFGESFERHRKLSDGNTRATHQLLGSLSESIRDQKYLISASSSPSRKKRSRGRFSRRGCHSSAQGSGLPACCTFGAGVAGFATGNGCDGAIGKCMAFV